MRLHAGAILALLAPLIVVAPFARATPSIPADDAVVLEQIPGSHDGSSIMLRRLTNSLARDRHNFTLALSVARLDLEQSRKLGDPRFLGRAEAALSLWPVSDLNTSPEMLLLYATIQQSNHDFPGSLATLDRVVAKRPDMTQAWLTMAAVYQAHGNYPAALQACGQVAVRTLGLVPDTCTASVMALTGHAPAVLRVLATLFDRDQTEMRAEPAVAVWALSLDAETQERLNDAAAEATYRRALAIDADDPYLLGAWSDWLLDHGRPGEVIALLAARTRIDPLLLRLALAEQAVGNPSLHTHLDALASRFAASRLRGDTVHRREEARFQLALLHQPDAALILALANWQVQREPADARVLLEAALADNKPRAASPVIAWLHHYGVQDYQIAVLAARAEGSHS